MVRNTKTLSIAIAVYNEEKNLAACLASVFSIADEIVLVDGGSTDSTVDIAKKFTTKIIRTTNPPVFHINKQKALDACTGDWILQLDADEIIPEELKKEIVRVIQNKDFNGYYIPRKNYFWGHWMKKGGQYPDYVIRLVARGKARFPSKTVHEQIAVDGPVGYLKTPMDHVSYKTHADYWRKAEAYTALTAQEMKKNNVPNTVRTWFTYNIVKPKLTFLSLFFRHKGFMDGWYGFIFALFSAMHFPMAYKKFIKLFVIIILFLVFAQPARADYFLPYPSYMPGNKLYGVSKVIERLESWWYWGSIGQIKYHMWLADKYLVEAKTLFEYKQYLLAVQALVASDIHIIIIPRYIDKAKSEGKDMSDFVMRFQSELVAHLDIINALIRMLPQTFNWTPENFQPTVLNIKDLLTHSWEIRERMRVP